MEPRRYDTDLTDEQYALVEPVLPRAKRMGRPPADLRRVIDAILYLNRTGRQWRLPPRDFPPWSTVHTWYRDWRKDGTWDAIHEALRRRVRLAAGRSPSPRSSAVDSQSVKTTAQGGEAGYDAGKKVKGRKRHIWVDGMGLLLAVAVTAADVPDGRAACGLPCRRAWDDPPRLRVVYADGQYRAECLREEVFAHAPFRPAVVSRPEGAVGWVRLPQRWLVERTFAWPGRARRLSKDYEREPDSSEAMAKVCMIHHMLRRLRPVRQSRTSRFRYAA